MAIISQASPLRAQLLVYLHQVLLGWRFLPLCVLVCELSAGAADVWVHLDTRSWGCTLEGSGDGAKRGKKKHLQCSAVLFEPKAFFAFVLIIYANHFLLHYKAYISLSKQHLTGFLGAFLSLFRALTWLKFIDLSIQYTNCSNTLSFTYRRQVGVSFWEQKLVSTSLLALLWTHQPPVFLCWRLSVGPRI